MKTKFALLTAMFFLMISMSYAQKKGESQSIISGKVNISKYHSRANLEKMTKGDLLVLYIERIEVIVNILPNIAFATKPGITMSTLGIPNESENRKALENQFEATDNFLESNEEFQKRILPYSDTDNVVSAILYYEETLKALHEYSEFH